MNDREICYLPAQSHLIAQDTLALGFRMASEPLTGSLLRTLAAAKPHGNFLELGTGTGLGTSAILAGMDAHSRLQSVENDERVLAVALRHLGNDKRVVFHHEDAATFILRAQGQLYDFIYADTWPGKYSHLSEALALLSPGGFYIIDDLLPQPNWPEGHAAKVPKLIAEIERRTDIAVTKLSWATGLMIATKLKQTS